MILTWKIMRMFMNYEVEVELKLNKVLPNLTKKLGMNYRVVRIKGGFKIFTEDCKPITYVNLIDKNFKLFDEFNNMPRYLRRNLIKDLRFITLFGNYDKEIKC